MICSHDKPFRFPAVLAVALAGSLFALLPVSASFANPGMGSMSSPQEPAKKSSGCGGCGGGEDHHGPSGDDLRRRAQQAAEGGTEDSGGVTLGSGGRRSEDLTGAISTLGRGAVEPGGEVPQGPPKLAGKGATLDDLNALIDANADPAQAERLKDIARRSTDIAKTDEDLAKIRKALENELERQRQGKLIPSLAAGAKEAWERTKDFAWRDGQNGKPTSGVLPDTGNVIIGTLKAGLDAEVAIGNTVIDGTLALTGDQQAQERTDRRYEDAAKTTLDTTDKLAEEAGKIPGKFSDAARDTKNLINDPHLRGLAADEASKQATDLANDLKDSLTEDDPKKRDKAQDRVIKRIPGGDNYLQATQDPDKPATERALHGGLAGLELGGTVVTVVEGVNLGKAITKGLTGAGTGTAAELAAGAGGAGEFAAAKAGAAGESGLARGGAAADEAALAGRGGASGESALARGEAAADEAATHGAKSGKLAELDPNDPRVKLTPSENAQVSGEAKSMLERAKAAEPAITRDVEGLTQSAGGKMEGLDFRVKGQDSLERKIATDMKKGLSPEAAAKDIVDANRYTAGFEPDKLVEGYDKVISGLKDQGYEITKVKNTWVDPSKSYKGVNVQATTPSGQPLELQFHTPESYWAKSEGTHKIYEEMRLLEAAGKKGSPEWIALDAEQMRIANSLQPPKGIENIKEYSKKP